MSSSMTSSPYVGPVSTDNCIPSWMADSEKSKSSFPVASDPMAQSTFVNV